MTMSLRDALMIADTDAERAVVIDEYVGTNIARLSTDANGNTNGKRDYKKERAWEERNGNKRVKERAARNKARKEAGLKVGDSRQADHKKPLSEGGSTNKSNIQILSRNDS